MYGNDFYGNFELFYGLKTNGQISALLLLNIVLFKESGTDLVGVNDLYLSWEFVQNVFGKKCAYRVYKKRQKLRHDKINALKHGRNLFLFDYLFIHSVFIRVYSTLFYLVHFYNEQN